MTLSLHGIGAGKGIAIGQVHVVDRGFVEVVERRVPPGQVAAEQARLNHALNLARDELTRVRERIPTDTPTDIAAFIDTHILMLEDMAIRNVPLAHIKELRCNAEWALKIQRDALVSVFNAMDDEYLRTRRDDVDHVINRVQRILIHGDSDTPRSGANSLAGKVVYADDLTPADTVLIQHQGVAGFLTEFGGPYSHTAILARSLGIPAVVGLHHSRPYLREDDTVIADGRQGTVLVSPDRFSLDHYRNCQQVIRQVQRKRRRLASAPAVSADGQSVNLQANVELPEDILAASRAGAAGVGLYRTEFLYMNRPEPPDEEEQLEAYVGLVKRLRGAPLTIRTLDLGADKQVDGARPGAPEFANPALGLRAVRLCLKEPGLFKTQLRAILRASAIGPVRLLVPMLSTTTELTEVARLLEQCRHELTAAGRAFDARMPIGGMIEVPAAAVCADLFARHLDFFSIGTNDLIQYTIAIDRIDDEVNYLYDPLHPAVLRLIQNTIRAGQRCGIPVAMCGEMAGDARYTRLLLGMGLKEFSVHPNAVLEVKQVIIESHIGATMKQVQRIMRSAKPAPREELLAKINAGICIRQDEDRHKRPPGKSS